MTELFSIPAEVTAPKETEEVHHIAAVVEEDAEDVVAEINVLNSKKQ